MRRLVVALLTMLSPLALLEASEPNRPDPPECMIAIFAGESSTTISCPTGTPLSVVSAIADLFRDSSSDEVNLQITGRRSFEYPRSTRWILLHMSKARTRINVSPEVPWDKLPGLIDTISSFGYASDARLVLYPELIEFDATNAKIWRWVDPDLNSGAG